LNVGQQDVDGGQNKFISASHNTGLVPSYAKVNSGQGQEAKKAKKTNAGSVGCGNIAFVIVLSLN